MHRRNRLAALLSLITGVILTSSAMASPEQVIEPGIEDQGFPIFVQEQRQEWIRVALPKGRLQPRPAATGIDECFARCPASIGW